MALTAKHLSLLFFLSLLSSHPTHARDLPQSFSKFTNTPTTTTTTTTNTNAKETVVVPNKEQEPSFLPDTQTGYGLYGHESGQLPPAATTANAKTPADAAYTATKTTNDAPYTATTTTNTNNHPYSYYDKEANYVTEGMSDTRFMDSTAATENNPYKEYVTKPQGYTTTTNNNNNYNTQTQGLSDTSFVDRGYTANAATTTPANNYNNNGANNNYYNTENKGLSDTRLVDRSYTTTTPANAAANNYNNNGANSYYNTERQGMSDTRFVENGKYYYPVTRENNYGSYGYENTREANYNNKGQRYYGNNENSYMGGYQNQEQFQGNEEEYVP
ncbi:hypothetical protein RHGRI_004695 [Rhododendron griersonianum]|uniref:Protein E6-like n=1 Tax=Rhododendron griersonianum TaxID=479676 RepID=A0AAV6L9K6_9ERIC|nr:hypothetical protein RHGRI_004695 [Rhododendron griersonianum]